MSETRIRDEHVVKDVGRVADVGYGERAESRAFVGVFRWRIGISGDEEVRVLLQSEEIC